MNEGRAVGARFDDLQHALRTVEVEIDRYESVLRVAPDEKLGLTSELTKLRSYRGEIIEKLKTLP
jgi:hypothetical protein